MTTTRTAIPGVANIADATLSTRALSLAATTPDGANGELPALPAESQTAASLVGFGGTLGASLYGGVIGGLAAAKWEGASTGAMAGGGISAAAYGTAMLMSRAWIPGVGFLAAGLAGLGLALYRWNEKR